MSTDNKEAKVLNKVKTLDEIKSDLNLHTVYDPATVLKEAEMALNQRKQVDSDDEEVEYDEPEEQPTYEDPLFRAMSLSEFKNGALMIDSVAEQYRTFGIDMLRKVQEEYKCSTIIEQATAELATINYIRTLAIQRRITSYLDMNSLTDNGVKYLAIMSKELDRANRHYLTAIQTLRMLKQPSFNVNVKANTAIVGQNQVIQENQNVNPI